MQGHRFGASPIVCVFDQKSHIRRFIREALGEFGFSVHECREPRDLRIAVNARSAELLVLSLSGGAGTAREVLCELAVAKFQGRVLPLASRDSDRMKEAGDIAEKLGLTMLSAAFRAVQQGAFEGLLIESNGTDIARNLSVVRDIAKQLRLLKVALSIDDLGAEWLSFIGLRDFPFVEVKVDRKLIAGCAKDRLKQSLCRHILALANGYGARTVAEGVETWADFLTVREMGFDLVQGFLFARPMSPQKFSRACWTHVPVGLKPAYSASFDVASSS